MTAKGKVEHPTANWNPGIGYGIKAGMIFGLLMGLSDLFLGLFYAEMSVHTYFWFFAAHLFLGVFFGISLGVIYNSLFKADKSDAGYLVLFFVVLLFFYDLVYLNWKFFGGFDVLVLREILAHFSRLSVMIVNLLLLASLVALKIVIRKVRPAEKYFTNIRDLMPVALMTFIFTGALNILFFRWPSPPGSLVKVCALTLLTAAIPGIVIVIRIFCDRLFSSLTESEVGRSLLGWGSAVILIFLIPLMANDPAYSSFQNRRYEPDRNKIAGLKGKPNIIWIVLDTARKDRFSCYGHVRNTTPNIDRFSKDGVLFTNYISTAPWTLPTHASMFTGMYSSKHGAHHDDVNPFLPLPDECVTLAEILRDQGYNTEAIVANHTLHRSTGIDQGFHFYVDESSEFNCFFWGLICSRSRVLRGTVVENVHLVRTNMSKLSSEVNSIVFKRLSKNISRPFFLFINYMEAHEGANYLPGNFESMFGFSWDKWQLLDQSKYVFKQKKIEPEFRQNHFNLLDAKMAFMDHNIGILFTKLKEMDLYDRSMIILVSDHGDLFGEHYSFGHSREIYNELIHVPMIIKYPRGMNLKGVNDQYVQTVDIMPEALSVLKIPFPEGIQGQPINDIDHGIVAELFRNKIESQMNPKRYYRDLRTIISEGSRDGMKYKYIKSSNGECELYNFVGDPYEDYNLISRKDATAEELEKELDEWRRSFSPVKTPNKDQKPMDMEMMDRLRALGYIR